MAEENNRIETNIIRNNAKRASISDRKGDMGDIETRIISFAIEARQRHTEKSKKVSEYYKWQIESEDINFVVWEWAFAKRATSCTPKVQISWIKEFKNRKHRIFGQIYWKITKVFTNYPGSCIRPIEIKRCIPLLSK